MAAMCVLIAWFYERRQSVALAQLIHIVSTRAQVVFSPPSMKASALSRDTSSVRVGGTRFFFLRRKNLFLSCIATKARFVNLAMETGSTNHLFGHRTSDHDSLFRRRDRSREQGAQSA